MPGRGRGRGRGQGWGHGAGRGLRDGTGMGAEGHCVCPKCGYRMVHRAGVPCLEERCPSCGVALLREGSPHHREVESRRTGGPTGS